MHDSPFPVASKEERARVLVADRQSAWPAIAVTRLQNELQVDITVLQVESLVELAATIAAAPEVPTCIWVSDAIDAAETTYRCLRRLAQQGNCLVILACRRKNRRLEALLGSAGAGLQVQNADQAYSVASAIRKFFDRLAVCAEPSAPQQVEKPRN